VAAIAAAEAGMTVVVARLPRAHAQRRSSGTKPPKSWATALRNAVSVEGLSTETLGYLNSVTDGVGPPEATPLVMGLPRRHVNVPRRPPSGAVAPFHGGELLTWNRACLSSPYGLLYTRASLPGAKEIVPPSTGRVEVNVIGGAPPDWSTTSPSAWLAARARRCGVALITAGSLHRLLFDEEGRVIGAAFAEKTVRVCDGVVLGAGPRHSDDSMLRRAWQPRDAQLGVASAVASRFGRLELMTSGTSPPSDPSREASADVVAPSRL
jgi:hypothetical protein